MTSKTGRMEGAAGGSGCAERQLGGTGWWSAGTRSYLAWSCHQFLEVQCTPHPRACLSLMEAGRSLHQCTLVLAAQEAQECVFVVEALPDVQVPVGLSHLHPCFLACVTPRFQHRPYA